MSDVTIGPFERFGVGIVGTDVAHDLSFEIVSGLEDPTSDQVTLDLRKPDFDLVEPTRIGRRVMEPNCRIGVEELKNTLGFVRAQVVGHDMNFSASRLAGHDRAQKVDKFDAGMPVGGLTDDVAGASIKCCIQ